MEKIKNFKLIYAADNHDEKINSLALSNWEMLPIGITWIFSGKKYEINNSNRILALVLENRCQIAIIEDHLDSLKNKAYILSGDAKIRWDITKIIRKHNNHAVFYDVYYINQELYFFINVNGVDYRFSFNDHTGEVGRLIESR